MEEELQQMLQTYIEQGIRNFIIFPYNNIGELTRQILRRVFHIQELFFVDNKLCRCNPKIRDIQYLQEYLLTHQKDNIHIIAASHNSETIKYIRGQCKSAEIIVPFPELRPRGSYGPLVDNPYMIRSMGQFCCFAAGSAVVENHPLDFVTQHTFIYSPCVTPEIDNQKFTVYDFNQEVEIGNDVWFGRNVIVVSGVKIGNGVRAAAGAVITKDVPDYAVVAGVPARIIKYRFTPDQIKKLNEIAWWDWPDEKIRECYDDFLDINVFLQKHYAAKD